MDTSRSRPGGDAFRRWTAVLAVAWALACVALSAASFLSLPTGPSHRFIATVVTGQYVVLGPDGTARRAGMQRGDLLLEVNGVRLSERPLSRAPVHVDEPNHYLLQRPWGVVYEAELTHRELGFGGLLQTPSTYAFLLLLGAVGAYLAVGVGVYRARPGLRSSWALLLLSTFVAAYLSGLLHPGRRVPGTELVLGFNAALMLVPGLHLVTMYPVELEAVRRRRRLLVLPYLVALGFFAVHAGAYFSGRGYARALGLLLHWNIALVTATGLYMVLARRHMPTHDLRDRLDIALLGYAVAAVPLALVLLLQDLLRTSLPSLFVFAWFVCFPLAIGIGILRQQVFGIRDVAKSSFVYGLLTVAITGSYALAVAILGTLSGTALLANPWFSFPVIFGLVLIFSPLRERLHDVADRLFERDRTYYQATVRRTSEALVSLLSVDDILERVLWTVSGPLGAECGAVLLLDEERQHYRIAAARGSSIPEGWRIATEHPLVKLVWAYREGLAQGELRERVLPEAYEESVRVFSELGVHLLVPLAFGVDLRGLVAVGRRRTGEELRPEDREVLRTLVNQASVAIENALAYEEIARLNRTLEARIEERTRELRDTQAALAEREKMASLGQLVAGVAHEINTPIAFVHSNLQLVGEQIARVLSALDQGDEGGAAAARENLDRLVERSQEGTRRIREIVQALRTFSRVDQAGMADADLVQGLDTTLELMTSRLHDVDVVRQVAPIPLVRCHAGQINQVLMNLLLNACDAGASRIVIHGAEEDGLVRIDLEDDGGGIPAEHLSRIFEPFFTTKEVGKGTGLGLAISHGIVERHGGRIRVLRSDETGTLFRVELPVRGPEEGSEAPS
jgi:signal transduction histidine kinase